MPFLIVRDDLAGLRADALVVTANPELRIEGTVGAAVAEVAGALELQAACDAIGGCAVGDAVLTPAFAAPARHIVHAVGPIWQGGDAGEAELLARTLRRLLGLVWDAGDRSVALPLVSAGTNGFPVREALAIHTEVITDFLDDHELAVTLALYDRRAVIAGTELELEIQSYIDDVYIEEHELGNSSRFYGAMPFDRESRRPLPGMPDGRALGSMAAPQASVPASAAGPAASSTRSKERKRGLPWRRKRGRKEREELEWRELGEPGAPGAPGFPAAPREVGAPPTFDEARPMAPVSLPELENRVAHLDLSFSQTLLRLIDLAGKTDAEVYKRANVSRQLFSKIRSDVQYRPTKKTAVAFAVALELSLDETEDLLARAGFALSHSRLFDVIVEYFIERGVYDAFAINEVLYAYDQELLGS